MSDYLCIVTYTFGGLYGLAKPYLVPLGTFTGFEPPLQGPISEPVLRRAVQDPGKPKKISIYLFWWFGKFYIFPNIGNNHPHWLIFFRGVETTNLYRLNVLLEGKLWTWNNLNPTFDDSTDTTWHNHLFHVEIWSQLWCIFLKFLDTWLPFVCSKPWNFNRVLVCFSWFIMISTFDQFFSYWNLLRTCLEHLRSQLGSPCWNSGPNFSARRTALRFLAAVGLEICHTWDIMGHPL